MTALPRLVAIDLDGTLLNAAKELTPRSIAAVRKLAAAGTTVVVASGRMYRASIKPHALRLGLDTPVIAYNGALIVSPQTDQIWFEKPVAPELASEVMAWCEAEDRHLNLYFEDQLYCRKQDAWVDLYVSRTGAKPVIREDLFEWAQGKPSTKLLSISEPAEIEELLPVWRERAGDRLFVTISDPEYLEFMDPGATKGWALLNLCERLGIDPSETAAFGDSGNDQPLLEAAGYKVAMAGARESLKQIADEIAPDHDEDGVAQVIEGWLS